MFEHHNEPLLPRPLFYRRMGRYGGLAVILIAGSWLIGTLAYRVFEGMGWTDAMLNAAMILGGMGPVSPLHSEAGKIFASFYALFAGLVFLATLGLLLTPIFHRMMHGFHIDAEKANDDDSDDNDADSKAVRRQQ